jgi:hypothetical protein
MLQRAICMPVPAKVTIDKLKSRHPSLPQAPSLLMVNRLPLKSVGPGAVCAEVDQHVGCAPRRAPVMSREDALPTLDDKTCQSISSLIESSVQSRSSQLELVPYR